MSEAVPGVKIIKKSYRSSSALSKPEDEMHKVIIEDDAPVAPAVATMSLTAEQKEALIEKMETKKHKIKTEYRETNDQELKRQYYEVCDLLAKIKECDAIDKMQDNIKDGTQLQSEFRQKFKELAVTDFNRIIDLTASKGERKPDISTEAWLKGRTVVFKDKVYRPPPEEKLERFRQKMQLKPMPSDMRRHMEASMDGNLKAAGIRKHNPDALKCKQYDPMEFTGLQTF